MRSFVHVVPHVVVLGIAPWSGELLADNADPAPTREGSAARSQRWILSFVETVHGWFSVQSPGLSMRPGADATVAEDREAPELIGGGLDAAQGEADTFLALALSNSECAIDDSAFQSLQGGCKDLASKLVWIRGGTLGSAWSWKAATSLCENLTANGLTDWRLPTVAKLQVIAAGGKYLHLQIQT